jgi:hypothetical protein
VLDTRQNNARLSQNCLAENPSPPSTKLLCLNLTKIPRMGRRPKAWVRRFFDRGAKLDDASNRYEHTCKACGEEVRIQIEQSKIVAFY